jgi:hypothetical protein
MFKYRNAMFIVYTSEQVLKVTKLFIRDKKSQLGEHDGEST